MLNSFNSKIYRGSTLFLTGLLLAFSSFFLSSCLKDDSNLDELSKEQEEAYYRQLATDTLAIKQHLATNNITTAKRMPSGLFYVEQTVGTGVQAKVGNIVSTNYRLTDLTGKQLDTSYGKSPYQFQLGTPGSPIFGYQQAVSLLKVGGKSTFYLPSGLAYGTTGSPPGIAPNTILIFEIELLAAQ
ncbi:FKBP-type peptidyl-prolyl cis-trans isomerase [Adhaeribacter rhizoryzae]|uniref:Peptidyl-prolyl cis-trans isomerase n=1 Tax=Adhaeribacter rhizoryzae TaxID=2607907 RepID=A0A5M6CWB9_9BACT|nr:FKBP-type peptidyl-prolyl cis-trans isomerase [Adhaeribacter rhizoryzae]KAA5539511.1 hypothetical protein F0145_24225 [Adhaeribacter rhizoryzae]